MNLNKRKWHYILPPQAFDCTCEKCGGRNLEWSEYEHHIWCYDCEIDFDPQDSINAGIFSGPIPIQTTAMFGTSFDRYLMKDDKIQRFNILTMKWEDDWFVYTWDELAKALLMDKLEELDDRYGDISYMKSKEIITSKAGEYYRKMLYEILNRYKDDNSSKG